VGPSSRVSINEGEGREKGEERTERRREFPTHVLHHLLASHVVHQVENDLDGSEDDGRIRVLKADRDLFGEEFGVVLFFGDVVHEGFEDVGLTPSASGGSLASHGGERKEGRKRTRKPHSSPSPTSSRYPHSISDECSHSAH
jgi:hypothetical protein